MIHEELCKDCKYEMVCGTMAIPGKNVEFIRPSSVTVIIKKDGTSKI